MSTSGSSSSHHHTIKSAVESLHSCLSNYGMEEADRLYFINSFQDVFMQQLQSRNEHDSYNDSDDSTTTGDAPIDPLAKKMSKLVDILNNSWIVSQPESNPTLSTPKQLPERLLQHLVCFSLLGNNDAVMTRRQLIYWWVGQGLIDVEDGQDAEEAADKVVRELVEAGAIEQVINKRKQRRTTKYRLIMKFSDQFMKDDQTVGLLAKEGASLKLLHHPSGRTIDGDKSIACIETLFNPDVSILNIRRDWLRKMRNLKVLHLGRWSSDKKHMEVESVEFLQALKHLHIVRFISFKGISRIMKLADEICSLGESLRVLDLHDCPNLEMLPKGIGRFKDLTHLDLSECFLLDRIPKGIVALTKLQVLKGFVITDVETSSSCKFKDLASHLGKTLIKLSIRTRKVSFPAEDDLKAFSQFEKLLKLKVVWLKIDDPDEEKKLFLQQENILKPKKSPEETTLSKPNESQQQDSVKLRDALHTRSLKRSFGKTFRRSKSLVSTGLPEQLQKLEVHAIPQAAVESLMLRNNQSLQQNLKKLYIIGGEVSDLITQGNVKWEKVETLRLKYLIKLHMSWIQLEVSFPMVTYLEMVHCPYLTFFPCDHNGIWSDHRP